MLFPKELIWRMPQAEKPTIYLTFDDGPHPTITPFVLEQLATYNAQATFFCIGKNVQNHPEVYERVIAAGHAVGNHTQNHLNGWKTDSQDYLDNIQEAANHIYSRIFRPPYGRIKLAQAKALYGQQHSWRIYMWDILSADFDTSITGKECLNHVLKHIAPGSIIVFHDSEKAWDRMSYALPRVLQFCKQKNWAMEALPAL